MENLLAPEEGISY